MRKQRKGGDKVNFSENKHKRGRRACNKSKNMNRFNYRKPSHFALDCTKSKVLYDQTRYSSEYVSSCFMLPKTIPYWTVDSTTINHIVRDRNAFVDFHRIPKESRTIYMGNNTLVDVLGIDTCKLVMRKGHNLYLHDVLYAPKV